jgi:hypothetical protein
MSRQPFSARVALAVAFALVAGIQPASALVRTVFDCPSANGSPFDPVTNGFYLSNLKAVNLHSVALGYRATSGSQYRLQLTISTGNYNGTVLFQGSQELSLLPGLTNTVTWATGDVAVPAGATLYFSHQVVAGGSGTPTFNVSPITCVGDLETANESQNQTGASIAVSVTEGLAAACSANATTLCLDDQPGDQRYAVTASFATSEGGGQSGSAGAVQTDSEGVNQGGLLWFFSPSNPEILVKVINGCALNQKRWVFFSALTNAGFHLTVTDMQTSQSATYSNKDLNTAQPVQDTSALPCP